MHKLTVTVATAALLVGWAGTSPVAAQLQDPIVDTGGSSQASREIVLPIGKAAVIDLPQDATDILVSEPAIVEAVIRTPRRVFLLGREAGQANAFFFGRNNQQLLNLEIRVEPDVDMISGLISRLMPDTRVTVDTVGGHVILSGTVDTAEEANRAADIARRFAGPDNLMNMMSVREPAQVMLKVRIVEMQHRLIRQLGIDLDGTARLDSSAIDFAVRNSFAVSGAPLGGLSGNVVTSGFDSIRDLNFAFDVFEQNGLVRTLAEPNIVSVSGREGSFLAGGEFPVPEATVEGTPSVSFKDFGVRLDFQPMVFSKGRIQLNMETEVSEISETSGLSIGTQQVVDDQGNVQTFDGFVVPGVTTRRAATTVELPSGGSIAIAGLLQENIADFVDGVPGLKETPVIGQLFRSKEFQSEQTELVIIVTAYLVEPTDEDQLADPGAGFTPAGAVESLLLGKLEAAYGLNGSSPTDRRLEGPFGFILD